MPDPGSEVLQNVFDMMQIDDKWSAREERGFTWWPHRFAQRVWVDPPVDDLGMAVHVVRAQTDLVTDIRDDETAILDKLAAFNAFATMNALVWHPDERRVSLNCAAYVHEENVGWLGRIFATAVAMQSADAHIRADMFSEMFKGKPHESQHPRNGKRKQPDDMLNILEAVFGPEGKKKSPFDRQHMERAVEFLGQMGLLATPGTDSLAVEFPFSGDTHAAVLASEGKNAPAETALVQAYGDVKNPQLGSGLFILMQLPITLPHAEAARAAAEMNRAEALSAFTRSHFFGAWCARPDQDLNFVMFYPAAGYAPNVLENLLLSVGLRARWSATTLTS